MLELDKPFLTSLLAITILCQGGNGGKVTDRFKTSTNQAPYICTDGEEDETLEIELELKLIADIGLIGMPNAGKPPSCRASPI